MTRFNHILIAAGLLLAFSIPVFAQAAAPGGQAAPGGGQGRQGRGGGRISVATAPIAVLNMFAKLKDEQKTKIEAAQTKLKEDRKAAAGDRTKMQEINKTATDDINAILTDEQKTALKDALPMVSLLAQSKSIPTPVLVSLKLTDDQLSKIKTAAMDAQEKIRAVPRADRATETPKLQADFKTKVDALLTDEQKKLIADYKPAKPTGAPTPPPAL